MNSWITAYLDSERKEKRKEIIYCEETGGWPFHISNAKANALQGGKVALTVIHNRR